MTWSRIASLRSDLSSVRMWIVDYLDEDLTSFITCLGVGWWSWGDGIESKFDGIDV